MIDIIEPTIKIKISKGHSGMWKAELKKGTLHIVKLAETPKEAYKLLEEYI